MKIIILGATGHIGSCLSYYFKKAGHTVYNYARSYHEYDKYHLNLSELKYAVSAHLLVNCIGVGTPAKLSQNTTELYEIENAWDDICIEYITKNKGSRYIYFSSGVANPLYRDTSIYCHVKVSMENKHLLLNLPIWNIRLYSFFSEFADWQSTHLLPSIVYAIQNKQTFVTPYFNVVRDYIHPFDLSTLLLNIDKCANIVEPSSCGPIDKNSIISWFSERYRLKVQYVQDHPSGKLEYIPREVPHEMSRIMTSRQTIEVECMKIFKEW